MPGRTLNNIESKLKRLWDNPPQEQPFPQLRSIEVWSPNGIRGVQSLRLPFKYPITAICGANGAGKTTALALAALAFHSPDGWYTHLGNANPKRNIGVRSYYRFGDFFKQGEGDSTIDQTRITWRYFNGEESSIEFIKSDRWGVYSRRPERPISYISLSRILPANETSGIVRNFINPDRTVGRTVLSTVFLNHLSSVMGRAYTSADVMDKKGLHFQNCSINTGTYTAFNMGGGESSVIALLCMLQTMPIGGVLVVDEIEAGLHLQAQRRLIDVLSQICLTKQIQIICSTHSEFFIDALPRAGRLLLKKTNNGHTVIENSSTRYAMYEMDGSCKPELIVYCEDLAAKAMLESALSHDLLVRLKIVPVGSDAKVVRQGVSHIRSDFDMRCLCVLDGDVNERNINRWINSERGERDDIDPDCLILPGDSLPPERWVVAQLFHQIYAENFSESFNCNIDVAEAHIEAMNVAADHHSIGFVLAQRVNLDEEQCLSRTMDAVAPSHPLLDEVRVRVEELLQ